MPWVVVHNYTGRTKFITELLLTWIWSVNCCLKWQLSALINLKVRKLAMLTLSFDWPFLRMMGMIALHWIPIEHYNRHGDWRLVGIASNNWNESGKKFVEKNQKVWIFSFSFEWWCLVCLAKLIFSDAWSWDMLLSTITNSSTQFFVLFIFSPLWSWSSGFLLSTECR